MTHYIKSAVLVCLTALACLAPRLGAQAQPPAQPPQDELASPKLRISWAAFKKLHDANGAVVIDVRDAVSYESGHIPGARNIPLNEIEKQVPALRKLATPIVFYCA